MTDSSTVPASIESAAYRLSEAHDTLLQANELFCVIRDAEMQGNESGISLLSIALIGIKITGREAETMEASIPEVL